MPEITKKLTVLAFSIVISLFLGRLIGTGQYLLVSLLLFALICITTASMHRALLAALVFSMSWYTSENLLLKLPYITIVAAAFVALEFLQYILSKKIPNTPILRLPILRFGVFCLFCMGSVLIGLTLFRHLGLLSPSSYGVPGGIRYALTVFVLMVFSVFLFMGFVDKSKLRLIPAFALVVAFLNLSLDALVYFSPRLYIYTQYIATSTNHEVIAALTGGAVSVFRLAALREFGFFLAAYLLSRFVLLKNTRMVHALPLGTILLLSLAALLIMLSGYRGYVVRLLILYVVAFWYYDRKLVFGLCAGVGSIWAGVVAMGSAITAFPPQFQRVLGVFPGAYKTMIAEGAHEGILWRADLFSRFFRYQFHQHPWFGRGIIGEVDLSMYMYLRDPVRFFERSQLYHSGIASCLDVVGIIGFCFVLLAQTIALWCCYKLLHQHRSVLNGWNFWCVIMFLTSIPLYWYSGFFTTQIPLLWLSALGVYLSYEHVVTQVGAEK